MREPMAGPDELLETLKGVEGWLARDEAWALHEDARTVPAGPGGPLIVDVGSYLGRSAIAMGLGVQARGGGRVVTIDPQRGERPERLRENLRTRGVDDVVEAWSMRSDAASEQVEPGSVDLIFIDASHSFDGVLQDMILWRPKLKDGAVVAFNDPFWPGVNRFLREYVFRISSPFREPRLVDNTVFVAHRPGQTLTRLEIELFPVVRGFLKHGRVRHAPDRWTWLPASLRGMGVRGDRRRFPRLVPRAEAAAQRAHEAHMRRRARR
jgi:methyltransferase family protein